MKKQVKNETMKRYCLKAQKNVEQIIDIIFQTNMRMEQKLSRTVLIKAIGSIFALLECILFKYKFILNQ